MVKEGYKMTELGEIPVEWEFINLGKTFKVKSGSFLPQSKIEKGKYPIYGGNGVVDYHKDFLFEEKKIVIGRVGAKCGCVYYTKPFSWITDNALFIDSKLIDYDDKFMVFYLSKLNLNKYASQSAQPIISGQKIYEIKIILPPLEEQQKIAEILSTNDELITKTDKLIEKTKEIKQGLMQELLTKGIGHTEFKDSELGEIPSNWEVNKLNQISDIIMGQSPDSKSYNEKGQGLPLFQGCTEFGYMYPKILKWSTQITKVAKPLDILISVRAPVGVININNVEACIGRGLASIQNKENSYNKYVYYLMLKQKTYLSKLSQGSTFDAINSSDLKNLKIPIPPLAEQKQIADILTSVDKKIEALGKRKQKLEEIKKGLMQDLLTGKVRTTNMEVK